jgi:predicted phosphodiesterase
MQYSEEQIIKLKELYYEYDRDWEKITKGYNRLYKEGRTESALRTALSRYGAYYDLSDKHLYVDVLKDTRRSKKRAARSLRDNQILAENLVRKEDILDSISDIIRRIEKVSRRGSGRKLIEKKRVKGLNHMTVELLLSDLHYGKLTKQFNAEVARDRMRQYTQVAIEELRNHELLFNVDGVIVALMGDIIESYTMHGLESAMGCEMTNSEQIVLAIESLLYDLLVPLLEAGYKLTIPCVTGNHDRTERDQTYNLIGRTNVTWIIYNTLEMLVKSLGYGNRAKFIITENPYILMDIYHNKVMYEHGHLIKNTNKKTIETHIANRQKQVSAVIDFFRMGHYHELTMYEQGRILINGCLPGQDSYADVCGFNTQAFQLINYYIKTDERPSCFYKSFPVYLR